MEGVENEENSIDQFAIDLLRRAKLRNQVITGKQVNFDPQKEERIEKIMEKLEKKTSSSSVKSPEKSTPAMSSSPSKTAVRPILKTILINEDDDEEDVSETSDRMKSALESSTQSTKKTVTTCDKLTGDTIVEAKTFIASDDSDDGMEEDEEEGVEEAGFEELPEDDEVPTTGSKVATTPQLSKTLKKFAEFHSTEEANSPIHNHTPLEALHYGNGTEQTATGHHKSASKGARTTRLSALAKTINEWEDDTTHHSIPGSRFHEPVNNTRASLAGKARYTSTAACSSPSASSPLNIGSKNGKTGELQGFSRLHGSPLKQIREKTQVNESSSDEEDRSSYMQQQLTSPKKTYFGGSPAKGTPTKKPSTSPHSRQSASPVKSPMKASSVSTTADIPSALRSPVKPASPAVSPHKYLSPVRPTADRRSTSPTKSPRKNKCATGSPFKHGSTTASTSNESSPAPKAVSAIRMKFEGKMAALGGSGGPPKPARSRVAPYSTPGNKPIVLHPSPGKKKFHFGDNERDPSSLSVSERAKLFESSNFCLARQRTPVTVVATQPKLAAIPFASSPSISEQPVKPQDIDISSVLPIEPRKQPVLTPPSSTAAVSPYPRPPPPPPPMPTTSTPTNVGAKRRSSSPPRQFSAENHSVKRIKVNALKPGKMYPSLTDIETETETEVEGHCSEVESMEDSIESQQSLGAEIETIAKAFSPIRPEYSAGKQHARYRPSEDFSATFACAEVDALIDEALEGQLDGITMDGTTMMETEIGDLPLKRNFSSSASLEHTVVQADGVVEQDVDILSRSSSLNQTAPEETSYSEADTTASSSFASSPVVFPSALSAGRELESQNSTRPEAVPPQNKQYYEAEAKTPTASTNEEEPFVPRQLMHTVSFYRKQQKQQKKLDICSELNEICEQNETSDESLEETHGQPSITEVIRKLEDEVEAHNSAIAQASKALNLCKSLLGFSDSTENIECERILLIETQKRLALLNSIHRLKTEGALSKQLPTVFSPSKQEVTPSSKGSMRISDIFVTLRRDYFNAQRAECQYHFICLVKNKHSIDHTPLLTFDSQKQGSKLKFTNEFHMDDLSPDFQVVLEFYYLETAKEYLPHEAKYRINAKKDSKQATLLSPLLTPSKKGGKGGDPASKLHARPQMFSPAGPDTIKSTSFKFCGSLSIDISSLQRTYWELDKVSGPLTGAINLKLQCFAVGGVEYKGFLTLFDDVSGYGAWVRRWCRLGPTVVEFWKYPEDEVQGLNPPLGTLNLHECVTSKVRPASREVCARANTLLLVTTRVPHPMDKDTLVTSCHKGYTAVRHLLSADTRDERDAWCHHLNKALANLRAWDPVAKQSVDDNLF